jgi:hypothetical protein
MAAEAVAAAIGTAEPVGVRLQAFAPATEGQETGG